MLPLTIEEGVDATATAPLDALTSGVVSAIGASGSEAEYHQRAAEVYREYSKHFGDDGGRPQRLRAFP